jgi:hypothetical protein
MIDNASPVAAPEQKPRWFCFTPERFIWVVLLVETLLWLSEHYRWFAFNEKKGHTVLIAIGVLALSLLGFALWFLSALFCRRRFQFGIRTLLVLTVAVAIPFSWLAVNVERAKRIQTLVAELEQKFECNVSYRESLRTPYWLTDILGEFFFAQVYRICQPNSEFSDKEFKRYCELDELEICYLNQNAITDAGLENIGNLTRLTDLMLRDTPTTDAGLKHLEQLHRLRMLDLTGTNTTEAAVQELQSKLPHCKISW